VDGNLHFPVPSINRLNQTELATFSILSSWVFFRDSVFLYFTYRVIQERAELEADLWDHILPDIYASQQYCVAAVKSCPVLNFSVVIFFWSFGIIESSIIKCWELSTTQASAGGVRDAALSHYPSVQTQSNRVNFAIFNASKG
jgi:hypothetical protein